MATIAAPIVQSAADLTSMVPSDMMDSFNAAGEGTAADTDTTVETPEVEQPDTIETPEPIGEPEPEPEPAQEEPEPEPEPVAAATTEELPEGVVSGKNRKGEEGVFVTKDRWNNTIYANHKLVQEVANLIGEPATVDAIKLRQDALVAQERMYADLTSGDPASQGAVLGYMMDEMKGAHGRGEVGIDPTISMAKAFYSTLKEKSQPAYAELRFNAARDLVGEMFRYAAETSDPALFNSAQHFARALGQVRPDQLSNVAGVRSILERAGIPFFSPEEMEGLAKGTDPIAQMRAENAALREQLNGRTSQSQAEQFNSWRTSLRDARDQAINTEAIIPALASIAPAWQKHPAEYKQFVTDPLQQKVGEVLAKDAGFQSSIRMLGDRAQRAVDPQVREQLATQIKSLYVNRAKLAVEAVKRPIIEFATKTLAERSANAHARRQAGQSRTAPSTATSVPRSVVPDDIGKMPNGVYDADFALKQMQRLFGG